VIRTQIQITEEQAQKLKALAARQHLSMAELIRRGVDKLLEHSIDPDEQRRKAIAAAGRFRSGQGDVSTRHDDHLAEAYRL
jgi:hypothetical protein